MGAGDRERLPRKMEFVVSSADIKPGTRVFLSNRERVSRLEYHRRYPMTVDEAYHGEGEGKDGE